MSNLSIFSNVVAKNLRHHEDRIRVAQLRVLSALFDILHILDMNEERYAYEYSLLLQNLCRGIDNAEVQTESNKLVLPNGVQLDNVHCLQQYGDIHQPLTVMLEHRNIEPKVFSNELELFPALERNLSIYFGFYNNWDQSIPYDFTNIKNSICLSSGGKINIDPKHGFLILTESTVPLLSINQLHPALRDKLLEITREEYPYV